ncbi:MAG: hypothetical protein ACRELV_11730 [Longimicrobiales bacterium]
MTRDHQEENCPVELRVRLPRALADEVEEVQRREPEALRWILQYGLTRRTIYRRLAAGLPPEERTQAG